MPFSLIPAPLLNGILLKSGSNWVLSWVEPSAGNLIIISELALVEMRSLFARRVREGTVSSENVARLKSDFLIHANEDYAIVVLDGKLLDLASNFVEQHSLRTLDATQLASAVQAKNNLDMPIIFVTADSNLLKAAADEGFLTENPLNHP